MAYSLLRLSQTGNRYQDLVLEDWQNIIQIK